MDQIILEYNYRTQVSCGLAGKDVHFFAFQKEDRRAHSASPSEEKWAIGTPEYFLSEAGRRTEGNQVVGGRDRGLGFSNDSVAVICQYYYS